MVCFGLLNPHVVRLMLDRSKFIGTVMPSSSKNAMASATAYRKIKETKTKQIPVMIFPDFQSIISVVRSGSFDKDFGKIVLCSAASKLLEHDLDPIDVECKGTLWQTTKVLGTTVNQAIAKSELEDEMIACLTSMPMRPEHHYSNHKKDISIPTLRELEDKLGTKKSDLSMKCLLKFIVYGFVSPLASKVGDNASDIIKNSNKKLAVKNIKAFSAFIKTAKVGMTKEALDYAKHIQGTIIATLLLKYLWRRHVHGRPSSLAVAESACPSSFAAVAGSLLTTTSDFPVPPSQVRTVATIASATSKTVTIIPVKQGMYSFAGILKHLKIEVSTTTLTDESFKVNKKPVWKDGISWWAVKKDAPLLIIFSNRKFKLEVAQNASA